MKEKERSEAKLGGLFLHDGVLAGQQLEPNLTQPNDFFMT